MADIDGIINGLERMRGVLDSHIERVGTASAMSVTPAGLGDIAELVKPIEVALPGQVSTELEKTLAAARGRDMRLKDIVAARAAIGQAYAGATAIRHAGGVDAVLAAGGLDAIEGAAAVYRDATVRDIVQQLGPAGQALNANRMTMVMGNGSRISWSDGVAAALTAPARQAELAQLSGQGVTALKEAAGAGERVRFAYSSGNAKQLMRTGREAFARTRELIGDADYADADAARRAVSSSQAAARLAAGRAAEAAAEAAGTNPVPIEAITAAMPESQRLLLGPSLAASAHAQATAFRDAVAGYDRYSVQFKETAAAFQPTLQELHGQFAPLQEAVEPASETLAQNVWAASTWVKRLATDVGRYDDEQAFSEAIDQLATLRDKLQVLAADPEAQQAGAREVAAMRDLLGDGAQPLDLPAVQDALANTSHPKLVSKAILEHFSNERAVGEDLATPNTADETRAMLGEVGLIHSAQEQAYGYEYKSYRVSDEPHLTAGRQLLVRLRAAARADLPVAEQYRSNALGAASSLEQALGKADDLYANPGNMQRAGQAGAELDAQIAGLERAAETTGLRSVLPSQRPMAATAADGTWQLNALDAFDAEPLPNPEDAAAVLDRQARELDHLAGLANPAYKLLGERLPQDQRDLGTLLRSTLVDRLAAIDGRWRMPDDVSLRIAQLQQSAAAANLAEAKGLPSEEDLRAVARQLRAWTMFTEGSLPATKADRIAVGARRAEPLEAETRRLIELVSVQKRDMKALTGSYDQVDAYIRDVLDTAGDRLSGGIAERLQASLDATGADLGRYQALVREYKGNEYVPDLFAFGQLQGDVEATTSLLRTQAGLGLGRPVEQAAAGGGITGPASWE